jgi:hypothetical protein
MEIMVKTSAGLVEFAKKYVGNPYWFGTFVQQCNQTLLNSRAKLYPGHYGSSRMPRYRDDIAKNKSCADCSGLIKGYGWADRNGTVKYATNGVRDMNADTFLSTATKKGSIGTIPEIPGLAVHFKGHIGVYIGNGDVVEARGFAHGIVITKLRSRPWTSWLQVPWIDYSAQAKPANSTEPASANNEAPVIFPLGFGERILKFGDTGEDVRALQRALIKLNYSVGALGADGDFSEKTESAAIAYQTVKKLKPDGIIIPLTRAALEADLPDTDIVIELDKPAPSKAGAKVVVISGGSAFIRNSPNTTGRTMGVAKAGDQFDYMGETSADGWQSVNHFNERGWISGKFARLVG